MRDKAEEKKEEAEEKTGIEIPDVPKSLPVLKVGGGLFLLVALVAIGTLFVAGNNRDLPPASEALDGVDSSGITNESEFYKQNERALMIQDRVIESRVTITADSDNIDKSSTSTLSKIEKMEIKF